MIPLVLHLRASNFFGGPERQIVRHVKHSRNYRHVVLTFIEKGRPNELADVCDKEGIQLVTIGTRTSYDISSIFKLRGIIKKLGPAVLCSHGYKPSVLCLFARLGLGAPLIVFSRGHTAEDMKVGFFEALELKVLRFADCVVAVSDGYANHLLACGVRHDSIRVVQNAIDSERMIQGLSVASKKRKQLGFGDGDFLIATAGRLSREKAQKDLIKAFSMIQPRYGNSHLLLLGDGPLRGELESMVRAENIRNVYFGGFRDDMDEVMCAIDLFVLSSLTEGLPNVILEACACKKPVVATNVGGIPDVIEDSVAGLLVPPSQPKLLAAAIEKCIVSPELAKEMGKAGYKKIREKFSFEVQTNKLEEVYAEVCMRKAGVYR